MTTEAAQPTGRDLDAAIAERVRGWTIAPEGDRWRVSATGEYVNSWCVDSPRLADLDDDVDDRLYGRYAMPRYSESTEAAMQVVEKLNAYGLRVVLTQDWHGSWMATIWCKDEWLCASGWYKALAEAICHASLNAAALQAVSPKE